MRKITESRGLTTLSGECIDDVVKVKEDEQLDGNCPMSVEYQLRRAFGLEREWLGMMCWCTAKTSGRAVK